MKISRLLGLVCLAFGAALFPLLPGCGGDTSSTGDDHADHADHGEHDGGHAGHGEHGEEHPEHGDNGGHIVVFDGGEYTAEWVEGTGDVESILVIMFDATKKNETAIAADSPMTITTTIDKDTPPQTFALTASGATDGKASRFMSADPGIQTAINVAHDAKGEILLTVEIDGKKLPAKLVPHKH